LRRPCVIQYQIVFLHFLLFCNFQKEELHKHGLTCRILLALLCSATLAPKNNNNNGTNSRVLVGREFNYRPTSRQELLLVKCRLYVGQSVLRFPLRKRKNKKRRDHHERPPLLIALLERTKRKKKQNRVRLIVDVSFLCSTTGGRTT